MATTIPSKGRTRRRNALRKQARAHARWSEIDTSWMKWVRCGVCRKTFCCNNYEDRQGRVKRVRGMIVCPWCQHNPEIDFVVRCILLAQKDPRKWVQKHGERRNGSYGAGPR